MAGAAAVRRLQWGQDAAGATWARLEARGAFTPAFAGEHFAAGDAIVSIVAPGTPLQWTTADGGRWPTEPLVLDAETRPDLAWWGP